MRAPAASLASPQWRIALFLFWTAVAAALVPFATDLESRLDGRARVEGAESVRAQMALTHEFDTPLANPTILVVEGLAPTQRTGDAETLRGLVERLETAGPGIRVISHLDAGDPLFVGANANSAVLLINAPGTPVADLQRIADDYLASASHELALYWTSESTAPGSTSACRGANGCRDRRTGLKRCPRSLGSTARACSRPSKS